MFQCAFRPALWALLMMAVVCQESERQRDFVGGHATPHLRQLSRVEHLPFPLSETFQSYADNPPRACGRASFERFRRADGSCNNLRTPFQGAALDTQRRLFSNNYLDHMGFPRTVDNNNQDLPSARSVSLACFDEEEDTDGNGANNLATQLVWQFGQFLAHDVTHLERAEGGDTCCEGFDRAFPNDGLFKPDDRQCFPLENPEGDAVIPEACSTFTRSFSVDVFGVREQVNAVTSYVDASAVYGSSQFLQNSIRTGIQGLLKTSRTNGVEQLPSTQNYPCQRPEELDGCPLAGDVRVSEQPGLAAIHTMFHLEHNRIARILFALNPHWSDERVFQETRKIIIAIEQKITYEDYLPLLLGNNAMNRFGLNDEYVYDETVDGGAVLDYTTSAFRFGHTLVNTVIDGSNLSDQFFLPITTNTDQFRTVPFFQAANRAHVFNNGFTSQVRGNLFKDVTIPGPSPRPGTALDLAALNIQRGRDHGIAPYSIVRDTCLEVLRLGPNRNETPSCHSEVYASVDDVELFVGGVSERPLNNAVLGATFACMTGIQFHRLKFGDRYFYETSGVGGFTDEQMELIKRTTLSSLICQLNPEENIQADAFRPVRGGNRPESCEDILQARDLEGGLSAWFDESHEGEIQVQFV